MPRVPEARAARAEPHRAGWRQFARRLFLAFLLFLLMSLNVPLSGGSAFVLVPAILLAWGSLLTGVAAGNLFVGLGPLRQAWVGLTIGAYMALLVPALVKGIPSMVDALGAVIALTLVPHLGRRDLRAAMRDWAIVIALSAYAALGVQAMWVLIGSLGLPVFFLVTLAPSLLFEALMLLSRRSGSGPKSIRGHTVPLVLATSTSVVLLGFTQFNRSMLPGWVLFFGLVVAVLIGAGLLLSYFTRRMVEAASGSRTTTNPVARALVELSYGPVIISLALYLPLSLLR